LNEPPPQPYIDTTVLEPGATSLSIIANSGFVTHAYVNSVWSGSTISGSFPPVDLLAPLKAGDKISLTQNVCGVESKMFDVVTVPRPIQ
jgi:hypothetical protein